MKRGWLVVVASAACTSSEPLLGQPTGASCPPTSTLTYASFGKPFADAYCTRCHARALVGAARMGAPSFHDFDTPSGIRAVAEHIDQTTAAGPASVNESMPPDGPVPTLEERRMLGEWIACGVPE